MGTRHVWGLTLLTATIAGCQPVPQPGPTTRESTLVQSPTTAPVDKEADALAKKAEEWAKMLETLQARRDAAATRPASTQPLADWLSATNSARLPASRPIEAGKPQQQSNSAPPAPLAPGTTPALVFSPPTTAPVIEVHAPTTPSTQPIVPAAPPPRVIVRDTLAERVEADLKSSPRDPAVNLNYQLVRFLQDQQAPDLTSLSSLSSDDRESISALLDAMTNFRAGLRNDPNGMADKKVRPLINLSDRLRAAADLQVPVATLCTTVRGFGAYDPLRTALVEGRENRAIIYCEIAGFASRVAGDGQWETRLTEELVLYRGDMEVWKKGKVDPINDLCRNRRHDFYAINMIQLPATLPAGPYTLKVTVIDQIANRVAETTVPVTIVGANVAGVK